jgi:hypothetical protein
MSRYWELGTMNHPVSNFGVHIADRYATTEVYQDIRVSAGSKAEYQGIRINLFCRVADILHAGKLIRWFASVFLCLVHSAYCLLHWGSS